MNDQVILQINDFFKFFFVNPGMIFGYLNDIFEKKYNSMQYIEEIENGFLFVFKDFESFKIRSTPLIKADLKEIKSNNHDQSNFFLKFFIPKEEFPKDGIIIEIKIISGDKSKIIPFLKDFIYSVSQNINIEIDNEQNLFFKIQDFDVIQKYANSLMNRFYKTKT